MTFHSPIWLYAAIPAAAFILGVYFWAARRRRHDLSVFASERLLPNLSRTVSRPKLFIKNALFLLGVLAVFFALARPQWGYKWEETKVRGIDIIFAVDTSKSMLAEDVKPNRLERSKLAILDLVNVLDSDRIGIIAFAGQAFLQCPLTLDYDAFRMSLEALDTDIITRGGTNIAAAIEEAETAFGKTSNRKIIVLISDGEELEASALEMAKRAAKNDVVIYTLGVGGAKGESIPVRDKFGRLGLLRDEKGNIVTSRLNEETLTEIAKATGGFYEPLSAGGMDTIYTDGLQKIPQQELSSRMKQLAIERFQIPLAAAIILIALEALIGTRKFFVRRISVLPALAFICMLPAAAPQLRAQDANAVTAPRDVFNNAVDFYDKGEFAKAKEEFAKAVKLAPEDFALHAKALYNMGNIDYDAARKTLEKAAPPQELAEKTIGIDRGAEQILRGGSALLAQGKKLLGQEADLISAAKNDEEKAQALANSPLKNQEFQQQLKQGISQCDEIAKASEAVKKELGENESVWNAALKTTQSAQNNFASAAALDPDFSRAKNNLQAAQTAEQNLSGQSKINKEMLDLISGKTFEQKLANIAELKEELKKLVRDDNQQNQDQNQEQQNQDQQQSSQDNQQNQDNQKDSEQSKDEQQNQDDKSQENKDNSQKENESSQDKDKEDESKDSEQNKEEQEGQNQENRDEKSDKGNDSQDKDGQAEKDSEPQGGDSPKDSEQSKDEQAIAPESAKDENAEEETQVSPSDSETAQQEEQAAAPGEEAAQEQQGEEEAVSPEQAAQEETKSEDYRRAAGVMTRNEAKQLLESMKDSEKILPMRGFGEQKDRFEKSYKDW